MYIMTGDHEEVEVKVLEYTEFQHGIHCGRAKVQFPEGDIITVPVVKCCKAGDTIKLYSWPSV